MLTLSAIGLRLPALLILCIVIAFATGCGGGAAAIGDLALSNAIVPGGDDCLTGTGWWDPETGEWVKAPEYQSGSNSSYGSTGTYGSTDSYGGDGGYSSGYGADGGSHSYGSY